LRGNDLLFAELAIAAALVEKPFRRAHARLVRQPAADHFDSCPVCGALVGIHVLLPQGGKSGAGIRPDFDWAARRATESPTRARPDHSPLWPVRHG
jgi:hypothetical protein